MASSSSTSSNENNSAKNIRNVAVFSKFNQNPSITKRLLEQFGSGTQPTQTHFSSLHYQNIQVNLVEFSNSHSIIKITDSAIIIIDCEEGVTFEVESQLRHVISERVKPVFFIDLKNPSPDVELLYQRLKKLMDDINLCISTYHDASMRKAMVDPVKGNVVFGSLWMNAFFTIPNFAKKHSEAVSMDEKTFAKQLWGDWFYDAETKQWHASQDQKKPLPRAICHFILEPLNMFMQQALSQSAQTTTSSVEEKIDRSVEQAIQQLLGNDALIEMLILHTPSPVQAQAYRTELMYTGLMQDEVATSIKACNPDGPLVVQIAKLVKLPGQREKLAGFGKVFSGVLEKGQGVKMLKTCNAGIQLPKFEAPSLTCDTSEPESDMAAAGNLFMFLVDEPLVSTGTLISSTSQNVFPLKESYGAYAPHVLNMTVEPKHAQDLPIMTSFLKTLARAEEDLDITVQETGEHVISCNSDFKLDYTRSLIRSHCTVPVEFPTTFTSHREVATTKSRTILTKSPNKHNRIYMTAEPLDQEISTAIEEGMLKISNAPTVLKQFNWDPMEARKIWAFGFNNTSALIVDRTKGIQYLTEIKDATCAAFQWATREGVLCEEPVRMSTFAIVDVTLRTDAIHRGGGQIIPTVRRNIYATQLCADSTLQQAYLHLRVHTLPQYLPAIYEIILLRAGTIISEEKSGPTTLLCAHIPAQDAMGIEVEIRSKTNKTAYTSTTFSHWDYLSTETFSPNLKEGKLLDTITAIRQRKGLREQVIALETLEDKL